MKKSLQRLIMSSSRETTSRDSSPQTGSATRAEKGEGQHSEAGSFFGSIAAFPEYIKGSIAELKKVHSPTRAETLQATLVTLVIMVVISIALFLMDFAFQNMMRALIA